MACLPVVERELRVHARMPSTYYVRSIVAAILIVFVVVLSWRGSSGGFQSGTEIFIYLSCIALLYCLLEGARTTSDCISEERREGTLGLLFLTDLTGYDVVLGKLAASSLNSFYGLIAIFPVLAIPLLMGGITGREFWRMVLVLVNTLFFSLALGIWVSAKSQDGRHAGKAAVCWMLFVTVAPPVLDAYFSVAGASTAIFSLFSPGFTTYMAYDACYKTSPERFWFSVCITHFVGWMLLFLAGHALSKNWRQGVGTERGEPDHAMQRWQSRMQAAALERSKRRRHWLEKNPVLWLAGRTDGPDAIVWLVGLVVLGGFVLQAISPSQVPWPSYVISGVSGLLFQLSVSARASRCFFESRKNGGLELLLSTPMTPAEIISGQRLALRNLIFWIIFVMLMVKFFSWQAQASQFMSMTPTQSFDFWSYFTFTTLAGVIVFILDIYALSWVSMWLGLLAKNHNQAIAKAFVYVVVLPWFATSLFWLHPILFLGWLGWALVPSLMVIKDIAFIQWSRRKLENEFRTVVSEGNPTKKRIRFSIRKL